MSLEGVGPFELLVLIEVILLSGLFGHQLGKMRGEVVAIITAIALGIALILVVLVVQA